MSKWWWRRRAPAPRIRPSCSAAAESPEPGFADMIVSIPPDANRKIGQVQWPKQLPGNPETDFVTFARRRSPRIRPSPPSTVLRESNKSEAMVYVHGFNERYENTVYGSRRSCTIPAPSAKSRRCCSHGPRKAMCSPMAMTAKAQSIRATPSKSCCNIWSRIRRSKRSRCSPIRWEIG